VFAMERIFQGDQHSVEPLQTSTVLRIVGSLFTENSVSGYLSGLVAPVFMLAFPLSIWVAHPLVTNARAAWKNITCSTALLFLPSLVQAVVPPEYFGWPPNLAADALHSSVAPRVAALNSLASGSLAAALHRNMLVGSCFILVKKKKKKKK
jgi:hypothetical protein